ncbi:hypothetical protein LNQ35_15910 [Yersinia ruckeri]|uniref:BRO-N domain-containing protein n=1 Tax=Yersinia ruckeri TaxID=29486 RepID=UPI002036F162|nr:BRO family protein [Yersinia ruckeri]MCK8543804.1 hypothetical protein [Yersinia ruckeri]MCK8553383.1 hypothetical protein [Yersinia ruckeri]MCW6518896.1 BRO family protein [Yersinia ruckeri]MCW6576981.1 BRO family protein [Yersinia ruckeri]MCW6586369.1 BRO family protein [Yersinia ruckeri]
MNNQLMIFNSADLGVSLSGMLYKGKPVFIAVDAAIALGYERPYDAIAAHCKSLIKLKHGEMASLGLEPKPNGISLAFEADIFRLIMRSRLPSAECVQDWVCEEVLPSIRETGSYNHQPQPMTEIEMIAAMAADAVRQQKRLNHVEDQVVAVTETIEKIKRGSIPVGWAGYSLLKTKSGMTVPKCKNLVNACRIPTDTITIMTPDGQPRPMAIVLEADFMAAFRKMMSEAEPRGTRWYHPKMGIFQAIGWAGAA